jgi:hypothetical protein
LKKRKEVRKMLKDFITSPMGLGEAKIKWIPIKEWHKSLNGDLSGIIGNFRFEIIEICEPEVLIKITRYAFE